MGGAAYIIQCKEELIRYEIIYKDDAVSPFQMEVIALLSAMQAVVALGIRQCSFRTDSEILANTFRPGKRLQQVGAADWRAYSQQVQIANLLAANQLFSCAYIAREENQRTDQLANQAQVEKMTYVGFTFPLFPDRSSNSSDY